MIEKQPSAEKEPEPKEYSFETGSRLALDRIMELYERTDHDLIVVINGSGTNVGKTRLEQFLGQELTRNKIRTESILDTNREALTERQKNAPTEGETAYKKYRIFFRTIQDMVYTSTQAFVDLHTSPDYVAPDLFIAIYRPDKPFSMPHAGLVPVGDIIIRNELAEDNPAKFGPKK